MVASEHTVSFLVASEGSRNYLIPCVFDLLGGVFSLEKI